MMHLLMFRIHFWLKGIDIIMTMTFWGARFVSCSSRSMAIDTGIYIRRESLVIGRPLQYG